MQKELATYAVCFLSKIQKGEKGRARDREGHNSMTKMVRARSTSCQDHQTTRIRQEHKSNTIRADTMKPTPCQGWGGGGEVYLYGGCLLYILYLVLLNNSLTKHVAKSPLIN